MLIIFFVFTDSHSKLIITFWIALILIAIIATFVFFYKKVSTDVVKFIGLFYI